MSELSWWPSLIVLGLGLVGGLLAALRLRRSGASDGRQHQVRDLELVAADLEARRDELYRRLRDDDGSLSAEERRALEASAARALRDLEAARAELRKLGGGRSDRRKDAGRRPESTAKRRQASTTEGSFSARHPLVTGFLLGGGMVAVVGLLIFWAIRDTGSGTRQSAAPTDEPHSETAALPAAARQELEALEAQLERDPGDVMARKRLALLLLSHDQFVPAFGEARRLLEADPQDIDGLYVQAVVRLQMGQSEPALELFDRVLALFPEHVQALAWRGVIFYQSGDISAAVTSWERGIQAAGGQHPELERMVRAALEEEAGLTATGVSASTAPAPPPVGDPGGFPVRIEAESLDSLPITAVLFVALRPTSGAPPVAVRRLERPRLPLELVLTTSDSMMGGELPESGVITVRLDQDGDLSTALPGDLAGEATASMGEWVSISLTSSS